MRDDDLTHATRRALRGARAAHAQHVAERIAAAARALAAAPRPPHLTRRAAHDEAADLHDAVAHLERLLASSRIIGSVPMIEIIMSGAAGIDDDGIARLKNLLPLLRAGLRCVIDATSGDGTAMQLDLPETGRPPGNARRIASAALWQLHVAGGDITAAADTSPAVEVVAAALALAGAHGSARRQVAGWLARHPTTAGGGRRLA